MTEVEKKVSATRYYTYNGYPMMDKLIYYRNLSTGYETISKGAGASIAANSISGVILDLAGYGSIAVALFGSALTAYHAYVDIAGTSPVNGSYEDFIQVKLNYDVYTKYTYADLGYGDGYRLGAVTQQVRLIDTDILQYYADYNGGKEVSTRNILNRTSATANYRNPAPMAIANIYTPWVEKISAEIDHHPIVF